MGSTSEIDGSEYLFYKTIPADIAFIRGTTIDCEGNLTMEEEVGFFSPCCLLPSRPRSTTALYRPGKADF